MASEVKQAESCHGEMDMAVKQVGLLPQWLRTLGRPLGVGALLAMLCALGTTGVRAQTAVTGETRVELTSTDQCLSVSRSGNDSVIVQARCDNAADQQWMLRPNGNGYALVVQSTGGCLDIEGASTLAGAAASQWGNCHNGANQRFLLQAQHGGYALVATHSDLCLGLKDGDERAGTRIVQQSCTGAENQTWRLPGLNVVSPWINVATWHCLSVGRASTDEGAKAAITDCRRSDRIANQRWQWRVAGDDYAFVAQHSGQCLTVDGASLDVDAPLVQRTCLAYGGEHQWFGLRPQGMGHALVARHSGLCLEVLLSARVVGNIVQRACNGSAAQTWRWTFDAPDNPALSGRWAPRVALSMVPAAAAHLPDGRILMWSAFDRLEFGGDNGRTYTQIYDPVSGNVSEKLVSNTGHDMFCPGIANLPDGRIHVSGGSSASSTSLFDPATGSWSATTPMNIARGYQGAVTLASGDVFTLGGSWSGGWGNKDAEVWTGPQGPWRRLAAIQAQTILTQDSDGVYRADNHGWFFAGPGGRVFHAGPSKEMHWFDLQGHGAVTSAGLRGNDDHAMNGNAVMFDTHRILTLGGAPDYQNRWATSAAHVIDIEANPVKVRAVASMAYARAFHNSVVLPDGQVMVIGGQTYPVVFSDDRAILAPELWNPSTETFRTVAPMRLARVYHSIALLLPDGRVLSGGGGLCGGCATNHPDLQIYSPPYLFKQDGTAARRPVIRSAPTQASVGSSLAVITDAAVNRFALVRMSSVTHSVNNEQRRVPLNFTTQSSTQYTVQLPASHDVLVPGYYMLFALNDRGVPSMASTVRIF